jgi:major membrane immunogen (membrane-anchored lipoprotein)
MLLALVVLLALPTAVGAASADGTYKGRATSMDRSFKYGKVTMKVRGGKVRNLKIEAVTTTGCGGFMTLVFAPSDPSTQITKGSAKLKNGRLSVTYRPDKTVEDQTTTISARVKGGKVTGQFASGDLCGNEGRFTAKR